MQVELRTIKQGDTFKRKLSSDNIFVRNHYNPKDSFGPANFSCSDYYDMNREIYLKPSTLVFINFDH